MYPVTSYIGSSVRLNEYEHNALHSLQEFCTLLAV